MRTRPILLSILLALILVIVTNTNLFDESHSGMTKFVSGASGSGGSSLEELLAEGVDMLSGQPARDAAARQVRQTKQDQQQQQRKKKRSSHGHGGRGNGEPACGPFKCPNAQHSPFPAPNYQPESNGCGSYGFKIHSKWHESCCDVHDKCYGTCNESRDGCDTAFRSCMMSRCKSLSKERGECEGQAEMFHTATQALGCSAFLDSQKVACRCGTKEEAEKAATAAAGRKGTKNGNKNGIKAKDEL